MDNRPLPPPIPPHLLPPAPSPKQKKGYGSKIAYLVVLCFVLLLGALAIWELLYSRDERSTEVAEQIAAEWGGAVNIDGPVFTTNRGGNPDANNVMPCVSDSVVCDSDTASVTMEIKDRIMPESFVCQAIVDTESLHRNIYEAEVYSADVSMTAKFKRDSILALSDTMYVELELPTKQIVKLSALKIGDKTIKWSNSLNRLYAEVDVSDMPEDIEVSTDFTVRGSGDLFISQVGDESEITIKGNASNPSFKGGTLPYERSVKDNEFSAKWIKSEVSGNATQRETSSVDNDPGYDDYSYSEDYNSADVELVYDYEADAIGTGFLVGVDRYQKVARSLKYSFFIILLTYISVFFTEIITKKEIPLLNYFLIGAALVIFYTLLLSFSEHLLFGTSYLIAAAMTVLLITSYMWKMLDSKKISLIIAIILTVLYGSCYMLMSIATYALLLGSLLLFVVLALMMYGSLKLGKPSPVPTQDNSTDKSGFKSE